MDYKKAGVDIEAGYKAVSLMKEHIASTMRPEVLTDIGGFSGAFSMKKFVGMEEPTLVSGTDGVGTKLKLAFILDKHDTIGIDCVAMCVNDIACAGGEPLFFLDYIACGKNEPEKIAKIVSGVADGCRQADSALIGGETVRKNEMITRQFLLSLRTDVTQMVYVWLSEMGIYANALFSDKESENYMLGAVNGFNEMMEYVENLIRKAVGYKLYITKEDSVADQICTYIDSHFREEIHRDELAELVYLNTDYMSRMFKKEKGVSISNYILQKRVDEAKKLLCGSSLPINTVSLHIGYSNFSYFTKMFKENTGLTPLEYRRKFGEGVRI